MIMLNDKKQLTCVVIFKNFLYICNRNGLAPRVPPCVTYF